MNEERDFLDDELEGLADWELEDREGHQNDDLVSLHESPSSRPLPGRRTIGSLAASRTRPARPLNIFLWPSGSNLMDEEIRGPVHASIQWHGPAPLAEVRTTGGGVYVLVNDAGRPLKAGRSGNFGGRVKEYRKSRYQNMPQRDRPHSMYLGYITMSRSDTDQRAPINTARVVGAIERTITRTLRRAGYGLPLEKEQGLHNKQRVRHAVRVESLLPARLVARWREVARLLGPGRTLSLRHDQQWEDDPDPMANLMTTHGWRDLVRHARDSLRRAGRASTRRRSRLTSAIGDLIVARDRALEQGVPRHIVRALEIAIAVAAGRPSVAGTDLRRTVAAPIGGTSAAIIERLVELMNVLLVPTRPESARIIGALEEGASTRVVLDLIQEALNRRRRS